jgi:hypothetical protein
MRAPTGSSVRLSLLLLLAACSASVTQAPTVDSDPSGGHETHVDPARHVVRMVEVAPDVSLEVLDYGGTGVPVTNTTAPSEPEYYCPVGRANALTESSPLS